MKRKYTVRSRKFYRSYIEALLVTLAVGLMLRFFVIAPYKIPTSTMAPALLAGDYIFVYKIPYGANIPFIGKVGEVQNLKRGDIVLFSYSRDLNTKFIKRVVGLPGDKIEYKNRQLIINDKALDSKILDDEAFGDLKGSEYFEFYSETTPEGYTYPVIYNRDQPSEELGPILVPSGEVFLLGDHRDNSDDSRYWGMVPKKNLDGKAILVWFSSDPQAPKVRWNRIFMPL